MSKIQRKGAVIDGLIREVSIIIEIRISFAKETSFCFSSKIAKTKRSSACRLSCPFPIVTPTAFIDNGIDTAKKSSSLFFAREFFKNRYAVSISEGMKLIAITTLAVEKSIHPIKGHSIA